MLHRIPVARECEVLGCNGAKKYVCRTATCRKGICTIHGKAHNKHDKLDWKALSTMNPTSKYQSAVLRGHSVWSAFSSYY